MRVDKKQELALKRRWRVRKKVVGTSSRPRMSVKFSGQHIYVQFIDDGAGRTIAAVSTRDKNPAAKASANKAGAILTGQRAAEAAQAANIKDVVFDRGSARYHGKLKALADAAREKGLNF